MVITDYHINIKAIKPFVYELTIKHRENGRQFGIICQSQIPPNIEGVFDAFKNNRKEFFIDIESEVVKDTPPVVVPTQSSTINSGSVVS